MYRKRILFLAEGATMAHFVRPLALADSLNTAEYEVCFYAPERFASYLRDKPFRLGKLDSMPGEQFLANIAKGAPLFPADVIRAYVKQDCEIIRSCKPDLVVGDMRPSLPISTHLEGARCAVIMNAYWSLYARRRSILPSIPLTRIVPSSLLTPLFRVAEPLIFAIHVGPMNRVRREFGLPSLPPDLRIMYTEGDFVLYPDIPEFVPTGNLPASHRYVGICEWTHPSPKPDWWESMLADPKPKVFVSLGSSGPLRVLPTLVKVLSKLPVSIVLSTSGRPVPGPATGIYVADLLPFTATAAVASLVVSHGGSGGLYPAIAAGTPVLGIPSNADMHLSTAYLTDSGAGLGIRVEDASEKRLQRTLEELLFEPRFRAAAKRWAAVFGRYDSAVLFRQFLSEALAGPAAGN